MNSKNLVFKRKEVTVSYEKLLFALSYEKPLSLNAISYEKLLYYVVSYEKPFYNIYCVSSF